MWDGIVYSDTEAAHTHAYLLPTVERKLREFARPGRLLDLGCGNGVVSAKLARDGFDVVGVDVSETGIALARQKWPNVRFEVASAYDDLSYLGPFDVILSLEVIEHLMSPRRMLHVIDRILAPHGVVIVSTPYHGYFKNVLIAASGRWDHHHGPLWDGGHIKFFSRATLRRLFEEIEFAEVDFSTAGRFPPVAKSMVAVFSRT